MNSQSSFYDDKVGVIGLQRNAETQFAVFPWYELAALCLQITNKNLQRPLS